jgi:hypothetical protein
MMLAGQERVATDGELDAHPQAESRQRYFGLASLYFSVS